MIRRQMCASTHGGGGYRMGTTFTVYREMNWPNKNIKAEFQCPCGYIGVLEPDEIVNHYYKIEESFWKWLKREIRYTEPRWGTYRFKSAGGVTYKYI